MNETENDGKIVISGISGRFPESETFEEFMNQLLTNKDLVTADDRRWPVGLYGLPPRSGKLKDLKYFDAEFFGVLPKQADLMDPQMRLLLETTYETILDAGINPGSLKGSSVGVFVAVLDSESHEAFTKSEDQISGYSLIGCSRSMFSNRLSYVFDFTGPSLSIDAGSSSSLIALNHAFLAIKAGQCDAAIVGAATLSLNPLMCLQFHQLNMLSPDGKCRTFDAQANGYVRSESIVTLLLQKADDAKRVYAEVVNIRTNADGYKAEGISFPSSRMQNRILRETYMEAGVDPNDVTYVEAHGTGTKVGDPVETNSVVDFFCTKERTKPLLIGSVKSNMGHSEPAAGLCAIAKAIVAMEKGILPANLHYSVPNPDIPGLSDGRIKVVDANTPWQGGYLGINSFGFGGTNAHLILKSNPKTKTNTLPPTPQRLPRLIPASGRTKQAVDFIFNKMSNEMTVDDEMMALWHSINSENIRGHPYRGYAVHRNGQLQSSQVELKDKEENRELWFVYGAMGSQWTGMGKEFMVIKTFEESIRRCGRALEPEGIDLVDLFIHDRDLSDIVISSVCIIAFQIAMTDLLLYLKLKPAKLIGHSLGELACAYADGALTAEQTILVAFWKMSHLKSSKCSKGKMAAVNMSWKEASDRCPAGVKPVCDNCSDNVTVSGLEDAVDEFIGKMEKENIFVSEVNSCGYAFHSEYIAPAQLKIRPCLEQIIPCPKPRSSKWISTSIPEHLWLSPLSRTVSGDYLVNNFLGPVYFHQGLNHVPKNAIVVEIDPHPTLGPALKRSLGPEAIIIHLSNRKNSDNLSLLVEGIGKAFINGLEPDIAKLYEPVCFPVSKGTHMIQSLVKWNHSTEHFVADFSKKNVLGIIEQKYEFDLSKETDSYLSGHDIDGRILFPATGYIILVWKSLAEHFGTNFEETSVIFKNVKLHQATVIPKIGSVKFLVKIVLETGEFELLAGESITVTGNVHLPEAEAEEYSQLPAPLVPEEDGQLLDLKTEDIYKEGRLRGYHYSGVFRCIKLTDNRVVRGKLEWIGNWISYLDGMLQFMALRFNTRNLYLATRFERIFIDPIKHFANVDLGATNCNVPIYSYANSDMVKSGGVEISGVKFTKGSANRKSIITPKLEEYKFAPYVDLKPGDRLKALTSCLQLVVQNMFGINVKVAEIGFGRDRKSYYASEIIQIIQDVPEMIAELTIFTDTVSANDPFFGDLGIRISNANPKSGQIGTNLNLIFGVNLMSDLSVLKNLSNSVKAGGFVLLEESAATNRDSNAKAAGLETVARKLYASKAFYLLRKLKPSVGASFVYLTENNYDWVDRLKESIKSSVEEYRNIVLVSQRGEQTVGILGLVSCLKKEARKHNIRSIFIQDSIAVPFSASHPEYAAQIKKDLLFNVLKGGVWGSYFHFRLSDTGEDDNLQHVDHAYLNTLTGGDLSSFKWIEGPLQFYQPQSYAQLRKELCTVYYATLNQRDFKIANGQIPVNALADDLNELDNIYGVEFSGRDSKGVRVMGMVSRGCLSNKVLGEPSKFLWKVPDAWTMEQATTVPAAYATSYYALSVRSRLKKGDSLLVHDGGSGVGQAAISIALHMGCKVITTVDSKEKKQRLMEIFPQLTDANIVDEFRDTVIKLLVMDQTKGRGVNFVLNSVQEMNTTYAGCLTKGGGATFIEIGQEQDRQNLNEPIKKDAAQFTEIESLHRIRTDDFFYDDFSVVDVKAVVKLIDEGLTNGAVRPLTSKLFFKDQIEEAFRYIGSNKLMGKVVVNIRNEEPLKISIPYPCLIRAYPRTYMNPEKSYIIAGGLGGFGLELANWLVTRGAKKLVLSSRDGVRTGLQSLSLRRWSEKKVDVSISSANIEELEGAQQLIKEAGNLGPVGGIFNLAAVLREKNIEDLSPEDFEIVASPKVKGTKNLDTISRKLCPELDYFVVFSSLAAGCGNGGQSTYGMANSAMERICEKRLADNLPGKAIQWGPVGDVGMVYDVFGESVKQVSGCLLQKMSSCLKTLDEFLQNPHPVLASSIINEKNKLREDSSKESIFDDIANILGIKNTTTMNLTSTFSDLGMDSLMGAEIKQTLERNYDVQLNAQDIRNLTFERLLELGSANFNQIIDDYA